MYIHFSVPFPRRAQKKTFIWYIYPASIAQSLLNPCVSPHEQQQETRQTNQHIGNTYRPIDVKYAKKHKIPKVLLHGVQKM